MPHDYTEYQLVEQPASGLFAELGWTIAVGNPHPSPLPKGKGVWVDESGLFGRETKGEAALVSRLRAALERLNPTLPPEAITAAVDELTRDRSAMSLEAGNREVYLLLKEDIRVSVADKEDGSAGTPRPTKSGGQTTVRVRVIDWENPANNDFLLVSQFSVTGALYTCRPDLVGFVNGLPLVVIELKKLGVCLHGRRSMKTSRTTTSLRATTGWRRWLRTSCGISSGAASSARRWWCPSTRPPR